MSKGEIAKFWVFSQGVESEVWNSKQILGQNSSYVFSVSSPQEGRLTQSHNEERSGRDRIFFWW